MNFELNGQQRVALEQTKLWWKNRNKQVWEISGAAGTGKTTIVEYLIKEIGLKRENVLFMAFVGKATLALSRKGNMAKTIHSSIYDLVEVPRTSSDGKVITKLGKVVTKKVFVKKESLPPNIKLLVVDEAAMVSEAIANDILSFNIPVIALGDRNQLPPVFGKPYFLRQPDIILTEIMRQNENNPIIYLSQLAIKGKPIKYGSYGKCQVINEDQMSDELLTYNDVIICGKNSTRDLFNTYFRHNIKHIEGTQPVIGDKIICRKNNWNLKLDENIYLINGLIGYIEDIYLESYNGKTIEIDFRPEFYKFKKFEKVKVDYNYLTTRIGKAIIDPFSFANVFEYAYAVTAHTMQGNESSKVLIYNERIFDEKTYRKWLYTAITRAIDEVYIVI